MATCYGKVRYDSERRANLVILQSKIARELRGNIRRQEQRAYRCSTCQRWHLTSQDLRP